MLENDKILIKNLWDSGQTIKSIVQMLPYNEVTSKKMIKELKTNGELLKRDSINKNNTKEKVLNAYNSGMTNPYELSEIYGLTKGTIENILSAAGIKRKRPTKNYKDRAKTEIDELSEKTQNIIDALNDGYKPKKIAEMYGVSTQWVYSIKNVHIKGIKRRK